MAGGCRGCGGKKYVSQNQMIREQKKDNLIGKKITTSNGKTYEVKKEGNKIVATPILK